MGRIVEVVDENGAKAPLYVRKYSDTLMIQLLKAHRSAKFNPPPQTDQVHSRIAGSDNGLPAELQPDPEPVPDEPGPANPIV
jgi:hypothetical protein